MIVFKNLVPNLVAVSFTMFFSVAAAYGKADIKPVSLVFEEIGATTGGEFPQPAFQRVVIKIKNIGDQAAGKTRSQICPDADDESFCIYQIFSNIKGFKRVYEDAALNYKRYTAGGTFTWEFSLPPATLKHCAFTQVSVDTHHTLGQFGFSDVFANDKATVLARRIGATGACLVQAPSAQPEFNDSMDNLIE